MTGAAAAGELRRRTMGVLRIAFISAAGLEFSAALSVALVAVYPGFNRLGLRPGFITPFHFGHLDLARAYLRPAPWLPLDEPIAGLDGATEALVVARLQARLAETGRGALIVSHRPAPLAICGRSLAMGQSLPDPHPTIAARMAPPIRLALPAGRGMA